MGEPLRDEILQACSAYSHKTDLWSSEDLAHFEELMSEMSKEVAGWPHSRLREVEVDLLFWYPVQNLFHDCFHTIAETRQSPSKTVLVALYQVISNSLQTDYFSLVDVSENEL